MRLSIAGEGGAGGNGDGGVNLVALGRRVLLRACVGEGGGGQMRGEGIRFIVRAVAHRFEPHKLEEQEEEAKGGRGRGS